MSQTTSTPNTGGVPVASLDGQVKWFNNHLNYGFITVVSEGEFKNTDVFVHQSNINASGFRTLRIGEYVSFEMIRNEEGAQHPYHASNVSGVHGGKLMCEIPRPAFNTNRTQGNYEGGGAAQPHQFRRRDGGNGNAGGNDQDAGGNGFQPRGNSGYRGGNGGGGGYRGRGGYRGGNRGGNQ